MLAVGDISRFAKVGNFASYCRCVSSQRLSDGKSKGHGNRKNGNRYLSWAFVEAAHLILSQRFRNACESVLIHSFLHLPNICIIESESRWQNSCQNHNLPQP